MWRDIDEPTREEIFLKEHGHPFNIHSIFNTAIHFKIYKQIFLAEDLSKLLQTVHFHPVKYEINRLKINITTQRWIYRLDCFFKFVR